MLASRQAYAAACIQLFSRIWAELDSLQTPYGPTPLSIRIEIVRLDLILAIDACDSMRWRSSLTPLQRLPMRTVLSEVLQLLDAPINEFPRQSIPQAQDHLLDTVLEYCRALNEGDGEPVLEEAVLPLRASEAHWVLRL